MKSRILPLIGVSFGVLLLSRAALVSSEVVGTDKAKAESHAEQDIKTANIAEIDEAMGADNNPVKGGGAKCLTGDVLAVMKKDLKRLETRKVEISKREAALETLEMKLKDQMKAVELANSTLETRINTLKTVADEDLTHLVAMYETMKPKQAAEIFNSMDPNFAAGFLREMNSTKAGLIMASMDARKSYSISVIIAGRNANYR